MMFNNLLVIIPAFNEEDKIETVIKDVKKYALPLIIDDCSTDKTYSKAQSADAVVIRHSKNYGYEKALETGFKYFLNSNYFYAITIDADGQHDSNMIPNFYNSLSSGSDCVVGNRNKLQRKSEYIFSFISKLLWGINDPLCGMKGYSKQCFDHNIPVYFDSVGTKYAINAVNRGLSISEIDIFTNERFDKPRFGSGIVANLHILKSLLKVCFYIK